MIELNYNTKQDFLSPEWVKKILDVGIEMQDAKYVIVKQGRKEYVCLKKETEDWGAVYREEHFVCPTYSMAELL